MKRALVLVVALLTLAAAKPPAKLVAMFTTTSGLCTTWRYRSAVFVTAYHCVEGHEEGLVNGKRAIVVKTDESHDLAALFVTDGAMDFPEWTIGSTPREGDQLRAYGYGEGIPLITYSRVIYPSFQWPHFNRSWLVVFGNFIAGMSGGPVVNERGQVVGVVQAGFDAAGEMQDIGLSASTDDLRAFVAGY